MWEHGDYILGNSGQVILFSGRGPWNDEALEKGAKNTNYGAESVDQSRPWGQLSCLYGESLFPPSTYELFLEQTRIRKNNGIRSIAIVILNSDISNTIKQQLSAGYDAIGVNYRFFNAIDDAINWLTSQQIDLDPLAVKQFFEKNHYKSL